VFGYPGSLGTIAAEVLGLLIVAHGGNRIREAPEPQKRPLQPRQVWAIRARLELAGNLRDLALFNLAIDSKLRGCDLVRLRVTDLVVGGSVRKRVSIIQSKTGRPVQFEVSENTRGSVMDWVKAPEIHGRCHLFPSRFHTSPHLSARQ
jgi:hypothetical protein